MTYIDLWDDAGPFLYRNMPETCLDSFFHEERDTLRISQGLGKWWLAEDGAMGQSPFDTLREAQLAGDAIVEEAEAALDAAMLAEAGLDAGAWKVVCEDGIRFQEIGGTRWIDGDTRQGMADRQRWDAMDGDDLVSKGHASPKAALAALLARPQAA